jgi:hypothetical protein
MPASLGGEASAPAANVSQMPAGGSAPAAQPVPKAAESLHRLKYADIQELKTKYPNGFLKAMGI